MKHKKLNDERTDVNEMKDEISTEFGRRIKEIRKVLNIKQKDFAASFGLASSYLSEIESGKIKPGFEFFFKITRIYDINPLYLLHGKEPKFLEKESKNKNSFRSMIDTSGNLEEFIWYLHHSPMVHYAALEFFARYKLHNRKDIEEDVKLLKEKKLK